MPMFYANSAALAIYVASIVPVYHSIHVREDDAVLSQDACASIVTSRLVIFGLMCFDFVFAARSAGKARPE